MRVGVWSVGHCIIPGVFLILCLSASTVRRVGPVRVLSSIRCIVKGTV